ncbi:MAG: response regulator transcription factor [Lachnospiraceae bacterium]|nr:response regulator transcription factor [Lachnospiraceae bacterium]
MKQKILIIDDEKMLTDLLAQHFRDNGYLTYIANNAGEAIAQLGEKPDIVLMDINMPDVDGLTLCKNIRNHVVCPIIFLTARITEQDKINGLRIGGDDYITKPFSLLELTARVEAHLRRDLRSRTEPDIVSSGGLIVNISERTVFYEGLEVELSKREFDIMEFLISNANQVFDKERIYEAVWGLDADGDSSVIKEHIRKIRAKLYKVTGKEYIETVWGVGYKWKK